MGRASSSKKVARAARAGGRSTGGRRSGGSLAWSGAILAVVVLGVALIVVSRGDADADDTPPRLNEHWHAAYGIDVCGAWQDPLVDTQGDQYGIHTHEDGLIHIHPTSNAATGENATLERFAEEVDLELEDDALELPGGERYEDGDDCAGEPGEVVVKVWDSPAATEGRLIEDDVADYAPQDGEVVAIAFIPEGTAGDLQMPPTVTRLQDPTAPEEGRPLVPLPGTDPITGEVTPTSPTEDPLAPAEPQPGEGEAPPAEDDPSTTTSSTP
jgi:hypothetical protein